MSGRPLGSVERAILVLEELAAAPGPVGTNELARRVGINASTVSRLLGTLDRAGFVEREAGGQRWQVGVRVVHLANAALARFDLRGLARPLLERLTERTGETSTLSLPANGEGVTADFVQSPHSVSSRAEIGRVSVAHATATGKVVLAFADGALDLICDPLTIFTPRTLSSCAAVAAEVQLVRARGVAEAVGEREPGLSAVAVPVMGTSGRLAAVLGVQGPDRFDQQARAAAVSELEAAARELASALR